MPKVSVHSLLRSCGHTLHKHGIMSGDSEAAKPGPGLAMPPRNVGTPFYLNLLVVASVVAGSTCSRVQLLPKVGVCACVQLAGSLWCREGEDLPGSWDCKTQLCRQGDHSLQP